MVGHRHWLVTLRLDRHLPWVEARALGRHQHSAAVTRPLDKPHRWAATRPLDKHLHLEAPLPLVRGALAQAPLGTRQRLSSPRQPAHSALEALVSSLHLETTLLRLLLLRAQSETLRLQGQDFWEVSSSNNNNSLHSRTARLDSKVRLAIWHSQVRLRRLGVTSKAAEMHLQRQQVQ